MTADLGGRTIYRLGLRPIACWDCGLECRQEHGYLFLVADVVCFQVKIFATGQRGPTKGTCVSLRVIRFNSKSLHIQ